MKKILTFPKYDRITLFAGQCLITGNGPVLAQRILSEDHSMPHSRDIESFGLFDTATPNFQTYYPNVTADDLVLKDEDFIYPIFRALSEVVVRKQYDPIDFSQNGVLKASMRKLVGQAVMVNHEAKVGNEVGVVKRVFWQEAFEQDGKKIPAGFNAEFMIDGKAHPNIARKILMDPPAIHSNSVTVEFGWEKSHPKMNDAEFMYKIGTFDNKGEQIRRIANEVRSYAETSLVSHGADPYAQQIRDGKINNPQYASQRDSLSEEDYRAPKFFAFSYKDSLSEVTIPNADNITDLDDQNNNTKTHNMDKSLVFLLASLAGIVLDANTQSLSDEDFEAQFDQAAFEAQLAERADALTAISTAVEQVVTLTAELETTNAEKTALEAFKTEATEKVTLADKVLADKKVEVKRLYALALDGKTNESTLTQLEASNFAALETFEEIYKAQLEGKFPATCKSCGSKEVSLSSAEGEHNEGKKDPIVKSLTDVRKELSTKKVNLSNLSGN